MINMEGMVLGFWYKMKPDDTVPRALKALKAFPMV